MTHTYLFDTDADGLCMTICPHRLTQGNCNELIRVGSFYERNSCPYCLLQTNTKVKCGYPLTKRLESK